jgi:hypothetical protein
MKYTDLLYGKHLFWWIAQFDWLLARQDFPVFPTAQYAIYIALRRESSFKQQNVSKSLSKLFKTKKNKPKINKGVTAVVKELSQYVFVNESQNYKVTFTMFITK